MEARDSINVYQVSTAQSDARPRRIADDNAVYRSLSAETSRNGPRGVAHGCCAGPICGARTGLAMP